MKNFLKTLEAEVSAWPSISIHPHRFGGREFRFGNAEVGHFEAFVTLYPRRCAKWKT